MTTSVQTRPANPFLQIQEFFSSLASVCEKTNTAFRRVHVMKTGEDGHIKSYDIRDEKTGKIIRSTSIVSYIEDIRTGNLYLDEEAYVVAFKCFLLVFAIPFYTVGKMAWHLFKLPFEIGVVAFDTLVKSGQQFALQRCYEGIHEMRRGFLQGVEIAGDELIEVVKAPLFGLGAELAAIGGMIKPHRFRAWEAIVENRWQNGISYKEDFRNIPPREGENCWQAFVKDIQEKRPFYLAYCFQVSGNVNDPCIHVIRRAPLQ